jgi:16S rRNA (uracil1498-N3)-methyltransferase
MPSYYCPELSTDSKIVTLQGDEFHHLSRVRRTNIGDLIRLNSGKGYLAEARVVFIGKQSADLEIIQTITPYSFLPHYAIAFALLKNHHDELAIEKCTELGARDFFPFTSKYSVRNEGKHTIARFARIALAAIKQCDNPFLPQVHSVLPLEATVALIREKGYMPVLCSEVERITMLKDIHNTVPPCFIIGPEGGFSEAELIALQDIHSIKLLPLICRAETAAIAVSAQYAGLNRS